MYIKEPKAQAQYSMIWMHGLGASYEDMVGLEAELNLDDIAIRHVFLQAPDRPVTINNFYKMPAWYDIVGTSLTDREDSEGIKASKKLIEEAIQAEVDKGVAVENIILSGFSQGGAMALYTGLSLKKRLKAIVGLSCYLPLAGRFDEPVADNLTDMPIYLAYGEMDPIVWPIWSQASIDKLKKMGLTDIYSQGFPMMHSVCVEEIMSLNNWLKQKL